MSRFYILATGPSINKIKEKEWEFLKKQNTMGISWFAKYGSFQPKYYYFHESNQRKTMHKILADFKQTFFITTKNHKLPSDAIREKRYQYITHTPFKEAFKGKIWYNDEPEPPASFAKVWAKDFSQQLLGFRGTLIAAMNAASILGADELFLCGVDLRDNRHFYQNEESNLFNDGLKNKGIKLKTHSSAVSFDNIRTVLDCLRWLSKYLTIYVTNKKSLLYKKKILKYRPIIC